MEFQSVEQLLDQKKVRITAMRQMVLEYFIENDKSVSLSDLESVFPRADRITLYRTLKTFEEKGIVHKIENATSEVKFALCKLDCSPAQHIDLHPHFHCLKCDETTCLESISIPSLSLPEGYQARDFNMMIKGFCRVCA